MSPFRHGLAVATMALALLSPTSSRAASQPSETGLFTKLTRSCHEVDLKTWSPPTQQIFKKAKVRLVKTEICNDGKYPIFTVNFNYDPRTSTDAYFHKLYAKLAETNGFEPFSFIDVDDSLIVNVGITPQHDLHISYEDYPPPGSNN